MAWFKRDKEVAADSVSLENGRAELGRQLGRVRRDLYSDDPIAAKDDRIGRDRLAIQLARTITTVADHSHSSVVALVGPWGSGKTSVVEQIREKLRDEGWYLANHNPWSYSDYSGTVLGFFSAIRDAVPKDVLGKGWRESVGGLALRIAPLGAVGQLGGLDASAPIGALGEWVYGDRGPEGLAREATRGLERLQHPLLVVLDDLDRLEPSELLLTFKLIRLLGRLPNVYYLIAYDEDTVIDVLTRTGLVGQDSARARQYLEKMVQVRLEIPPLMETQKADLVTAGVQDLLATHDITLEADDEVRLQQAWQECLTRYLVQPRAVKRLITQVDALWAEVAGEVNFLDFLLVTFLRTFEKSAFDLMVESRDELLGSWRSEYREEANPAKWSRWNDTLKELGVQHPRAVASLLAEMFLVLRGAKENTGYAPGFQEDIRRRRGIGSDEFFDRYVQVGVPTGDLPDHLVREAVEELRADESGVALSTLRPFWGTDPLRILSKLERVDEGEQLPPRATLALLGEYYLDVSADRSGLLGSAAPLRMLAMAHGLLERLPTEEAVEAIAALAATSDSHLLMLADTLRRTTHAEADDAGQPPWVEPAVPRVAPLLTAHLMEATERPIDDDLRLVDFLYAHLQVVGGPQTQQVLWEAIEQGRWGLPNLLGALVPVGTASNGRGSWKSLGDLSEGAVEELLGMDRVLEALPSGTPINPVPRAPVPAGSHEQIPADARIAHALSCIEKMRERRNRRAAPTEDARDPGQIE